MFKTTKAQRKNNERITAWLEGYPFRENSRDRNPSIPDLTIERVLDEYVPGWVQDLGKYYTPLEMGATLISHLGIHDWRGLRVLEPCAGIGNLVYHLQNTDAEVDAFDVDEEAIKLGRRLFPFANWRHDIPFDCAGELAGKYDVVLMNPPFGTTCGTAEGDRQCEGRCHRSEHLFLDLAIRALKPEGRVAIIAPYNYLDKLPKLERKWLDEHANVEYITSGPLPGKFQCTGISVYGFYLTRLEDSEPVPVEIPVLAEIPNRAEEVEESRSFLKVPSRPGSHSKQNPCQLSLF